MGHQIEVGTRVKLLKHIEENPGIRYRELLRLAGIVNGVLTYHLAALEKANVVKVDRQSRITRYFPVTISDNESGILRFLRHEPLRQILLFILDHEMCTFDEIVHHTRKSASTVSSHLKRLKEAGIVSVRSGEYRFYSLVPKDLIAEVLSKYKPSFVDRLVDNYADMVQEL